MYGYLKLAWRNIWRNKRRTVITTASVLFALLFALIMRSMQLGTYRRMTDNLVQSYTGYIQIHKAGYWNDKDINNSFSDTNRLRRFLETTPNITDVVPRLEYFALASSGQQTKGVALIGIDPEKEDQFTHLTKWITEGSFLHKGDSGVMVAAKLSKYLRLKIGDTMVLLGQGYHGVSAAGKFPVRGILNFPSPDMNSQMVYMNLNVCQDFFSAGENITSLAINLANPDKIDETVAIISSNSLTRELEVMKWDKLLEEIVQYIKADNSGGIIFLAILYLVIAFGVFGTVVMMTAERRKEFGVMVAVGMQKYKLAIVTAVEMLIVGLIGIISGIALSIPILSWYFHHPIVLTGDYATTAENYGIEPLMCFAFQPDFYITQALIVTIIVIAATLYPVISILRMNVIQSIHSKI
jgi:ABC-type lipoprotein release transport system permease subunit